MRLKSGVPAAPDHRAGPAARRFSPGSIRTAPAYKKPLLFGKRLWIKNQGLYGPVQVSGSFIMTASFHGYTLNVYSVLLPATMENVMDSPGYG